MNRYIDLLKKHHLKATPQRICILHELDKKTHPNIDELYSYIKKTHSNISLATIYKNLNTLMEKGVVIFIDVNGKTCFDICFFQHAHCVCGNCGKVFDVDIEFDEYINKLSVDTGLDIKEINILLNVKKCSSC